MDTNLITYLACICFIFIFGRIFIVPLKKVLKLIFNSILGGMTIYIINLIGATFGFHIGLNLFTSIVIRNLRITRSCLLNYCKTFNRVDEKKNEIVFRFRSFIIYSTVTDLAKFLGLSTSNPFSFEI